MASKCITIEQYLDTLKEIAEKVEIDQLGDPETRLNVWYIDDSTVMKMVETLQVPNSIKSSKIAQKLNSSLDIPARDQKKVSEFIERLKKNAQSEDENTSARFQAVALRELMSAIKGEVDIASNENIDLDTISPDGVPNIPMPRVAAMIGRRTMYQLGYRSTGLGNTARAAKAEHLYYLVGEKILEALQAGGFLKIHEKNTGQKTLVNYNKESIDSISKKGVKVTEAVKSITVNPEALGLNTKTDNVISLLSGFTEDYDGVFVSYAKVIDAITRVTVPEKITFPSNEPDTRKRKRYKKNVYTPSTELEKTVKEVESKPLYLNKDIQSLFSNIVKELKGTNMSASKWIKENLTNRKNLSSLFNIESVNFVESDRDSHAGRNLSKTTPINDIVEYFDKFKDDVGMYFNLFLGRNARSYNENSVMNYQTSKSVRYSLEVDPYTLEVGSDPYKFYVDKIALEALPKDENGNSAAQTLVSENMKGRLGEKEIEALLKGYDKYLKADVAVDQLNALALMAQSGAKFENFSSLLASAKAIKGIRDSLDSGTLETTYMVSSDATASGALLTFLQALSSTSNKKISDLLFSFGVFKNGNKENLKNVEDVYGILTSNLEPFLSGTVEEEGSMQLDIPTGYEETAIKEVLSIVKNNLYGGNFRDLSKSPTMTFVYDQSAEGAINSMAEAFTENLIKKLNVSGPVDAEVIRLLNLISLEKISTQADVAKLRASPSFKKELKNGFINSGVPEFLYDALTTTVTAQYLSNHKNVGTSVFNLAKKLVKDPDFKVLPAAYVREKMTNLKEGETWEPTLEEIKEYGIPMSKIEDSAKEMDNGDIVFTRDQKLAKTVMNTSFIHGADTASIFGAVSGLPTKYNSGVILVHDDIRGNAFVVMDAEKSYVQATKETAYHFDIQEQVLFAVKAYAGLDENSIESYTKLLNEVQERKALKQRILEEKFDEQTNSIIGDGIGYRSIEMPSKKTKTQTTKESGTKRSTANDKNSARTKNSTSKNEKRSRTVTLQKLKALAKESSIIRGFLNANNTLSFSSSKDSSFDPSTDTVKVSDKASVSEIEHEIVHSYTTALIQKVENHRNGDKISFGDKKEEQIFNQSIRDVTYAEKALSKLNLNSLSNKAYQRMLYVKASGDAKVQVAEFISIMSTEPEVAKEVYASLDNGSRVKNVIQRIVNKIQEIIKGATTQDILSPDIDAEILYSSINNLVAEGKTFRQNNYEQTLELQKQYGTELFARSKAGAYVDKSRDYFELLNSSIARSINDPAIRKTLSLTANLDDLLREKFQNYARAIDYLRGVYDDSEGLKSLVHKITNSKINNKTKNIVLSHFSRLRSERNELISRELAKFKAITNNMSDDEISSYYDFVSKMPLQHYFKYAEGVTDIADRLKELKNVVDANGNANSAKLDKIVYMNVNDVIDQRTPYSIEEVFGSAGDKRKAAEEYVVLKSITELGEARFDKFLKNEPLISLVKDHLLANEALSFESGLNTSYVRDNKLAENYENPIAKTVVRADNKAQIASMEKSGWKVLEVSQDSRAPVVMYKTEIDQTFQEGVFTDLRSQSMDIPVDDSFKNAPNVIKTNDGSYRLVLSSAQRKALGASQDPSQAIVRTMAHNLLLKESQIIRDKLLEKEVYWDFKDASAEDLVKTVEDKEIDNPWFLGSSSDFDLKDHPKLKAIYMPINKKMSDYNNFDEKVQYVRKDIAYWLIGYNEKSVARDPKLQWAVRLTKNVISGTKLGLVALNPVKILNDNLSNIAYLGVRGVDPIFLQKQYREISAEFNEYQGIKNKYLGLKVKSYANPNQYKSEIERLEKELKNHPANGIVERGFLNSMGSELIMNTDDPSSGFKKDLDALLKKVLQDNKGKNNKVGQMMMKVANWNIGLEEFLETVSPFFGTMNSTKEVEKSLNDIADRWKSIKTQEDAVSYMQQYMNSPDSEFVKLGTHFTDLSDVMAKETLYRHLISNGADPKEAEIEVIDSFPDYKEAMPMRVRQLSDVGVVMFPSYWLRIQKTIYRMFKDRPASFGVETLISEALGGSPNIVDSNIFSKFNSHYGIFHNPWDNAGVGALFPTHAF